MSAQPPKYGMFITRAATGCLALIALMAVSCEQRAVDARAKLADERIAQAICEVWNPITDTSSPQVRAQNRARYAFCEGKLPANPGEVK